uniref:Protein WVD2-like 1 n=1 Tax=Noccaea caerulescens TaxID=107243 RepID=A0A1J3HAR2_NOCCA
MAGSEIQDPFNLSFQTNSIHSGSVSFGRFEKEGLSWEKRSSFSHNRYLEEVDKCSKPGSVTEMKAHFEAHFKKKGIRFPDSLESHQTWGVRQPDDDGDAVYGTESFEDYRSDDESFSDNTSQSDIHEQEKCEYDEGSDRCGVSYDEIVVNSDDVIELDEEGGTTLDVPLDSGEVSEVPKEDLGLPEKPLEIEVRDGDEETESRIDQDVPTKASDVTERPPSSSSASGPKPLESISHALSVTKDSTKRHDVTPKADSRKTKCSSLSTSSKTNVDAKSQKDLRPKKTVESRPPTAKKTENRTPLVTNRCKSSNYSAKLEMSTSASGFRFKSSERAEKRKEFYTKLEEKIHAKKTETNQVQAKTQQKAETEIKQFRKSLNFKAKPMPSFYNTGAKPVSHNKTEPSKVALSRPRHTTSASVTNRAVTRVGYKHGFEGSKTVKAMVGDKKTECG